MCRREALYIYNPPDDQGGKWHFCRFCNFAGDTIELYQAANGIKSVREAVHDLVERELLKKDEGDPTSEDINIYLKSYVKQRARVRELFRRMQEQVVTWRSEWADIMHAYNLWGGSSVSAWHRMLGRFIGGATKNDWRAAGLLSVVPRGFGSALVVPFYDVPGRISSFLLISKRGTARVYPDEFSVIPEDGLMMLDTLTINDDEPAYATSDPIIALQLQGRSFSCDNRPLKLVVYGPNTNMAWRSVTARRLIFWDEFGYHLFEQARHYPRANVARRPLFRSRNDVFRAYGLPAILAAFNKQTYTWAEAMRDFILTEDAALVSDVLTELKLEAHERNKIYEVTGPKKRGKLRDRLSEMPVTTSVVIDKVRIEENDDGWWAIYKRSRELVSNVVIRIHEAIHIEGSDQNRYKGTLHVDGKTVEFEGDMKLIEKTTFDWLQAEMMKNGLGVPSGTKRFRNKLIEIAKRFLQPQFVQRFDALGWDAEDQRFIFPNFSVKDGKLDNSTCGTGEKSKSMPAVNLTMDPLSHGDWDVLLVDEPWWAMTWATLACFMTNLVSPILGFVPQTIGLIGGMGSAANVMGRHLAKELGMLSVVDGKVRSRDLWIFVEEELKKHSYPVWVAIDDMARFSKFVKHSDQYNAMASIPYMTAAALMVGESWVFVNAPQIVPQRKSLPKLTGVMRFLSWWQAHGFESPIGTSPQGCVLQKLKEWADEELKALDLNVFESANKILCTSELLGLDRRLLWLIFAIREQLSVKLIDREFYRDFLPGMQPQVGPSYFMATDNDTQHVYVAGVHLRRSIGRLPGVALDAAVQALAANASQNGFEPAADGFVLDKPYLEAEERRWRRWRG